MVKRKRDDDDPSYYLKEPRRKVPLLSNEFESKILQLIKESYLDYVSTGLPKLKYSQATWSSFVNKYLPKFYIASKNNFAIKDIGNFLNSRFRIKYSIEEGRLLIQGQAIHTIFKKLCGLDGDFAQAMTAKFEEMYAKLDDELALQVWSYNLTHDFFCSLKSKQAIKKDDAKISREPLILDDPERLYEKRINLLVKINDTENVQRENGKTMVMPCIVRDLYNKLREEIHGKFSIPKEKIHERFIFELKERFYERPRYEECELKFTVDNVIAYYEELISLLEARTIFECVECTASQSFDGSYDGSGEVILRNKAIYHLNNRLRKGVENSKMSIVNNSFNWWNSQEYASDDDMNACTASDDNKMNETSSCVNAI